MDAQSTTEPATIEATETESPAFEDLTLDELTLDELTLEEPVLEDSAAEATISDALEAVELELTLHTQNLVSLGFEESIRTALEGIGGEILFQMRMEREDCQRIAAVRLGRGDEQQFALVIMPPGGGLMRVEPVAQSTNPLAMITESYAGLVDVFRAAA